MLQQQSDMYQAQLTDLDAAYDQLFAECQALRVAGTGSSSHGAGEASGNSGPLPGPETENSGRVGTSMAMQQGMRDSCQPLVAERVRDLGQPHPVLGEAPLSSEPQPAEGSLHVDRLRQMQESLECLEDKLHTVTTERDMMLAGIGDIELATASRLEKTEQAQQELLAACARATAAAADAEQARQVCRDQAAEIATLRGMVHEQQGVLEEGRQGAVRLEGEIAELQVALQAAKVTAAAEVAAGGAAAESSSDAHSRLAAAHEELEAVTGQLQQHEEAMQALKEQHQAAIVMAADQERVLLQRCMDAEGALVALCEEHTIALAELRGKHAGMVEDIRVEAREMVKKGTADLQQALKGAQAQLQVRRAAHLRHVQLLLNWAKYPRICSVLLSGLAVLAD